MATQEHGSGHSLPIGYPKHTESFETYYYLGELRTLKHAARFRFGQLVPDCPPDNPAYASKFESFYTKFKRWAKAEDWDGWCIRKGLEERQKTEREARSKLMSLDKTLTTYQGLVRQSLVVWAEKVKAALDLRTAISQGDVVKITELSAKERFELRTTQDVKIFMDLDVHLQNLRESMPALPPEEKDRLTEAEGERLDTVMESIRKAALEIPTKRVADTSVVVPTNGGEAKTEAEEPEEADEPGD